MDLLRLAEELYITSPENNKRGVIPLSFANLSVSQKELYLEQARKIEAFLNRK